MARTEVHEQGNPGPRTNWGAMGLAKGRAGGWAPSVLVIAVAVVCYLLALGPLLARLGDHPAFAYNWEGHTAWRVWSFWGAARPSFGAILTPTEGLMTESGRGPLVGLPVWLGFAWSGVDLVGLRRPVALLAAGAVPLLWLVGRRLIGDGGALLAAALLAVSPVFLLYGRTATLVGVSLPPTLLIALTLARLVPPRGADAQSGRLGDVLALQGALLLSIYAYAPVRLLWPVALVVLAVEAWRQAARRRELLAALAVTVVALPLALTLLSALTGSGEVKAPSTAVADFYRARGEQVLELSQAPGEYGYYLRPTAREEATGGLSGSRAALARRLIGQNSADLLRLLLDRGTAPTLTDFWNPHGRLWAAALVPGFWVGLAATAWGARRRPGDRLLLALVAGLTLPLLLTSRVHVGRLVPALPFLLLLVAVGWRVLMGGVIASLRRAADDRWEARWPALPVVRVVGALALVLVAAITTWVEYRQPPAPTEEALLAESVAGRLPSTGRSGNLALVEAPELGTEVEAVRAATLRLALAARLRVVDLAMTPDPVAGEEDGRPTLYTVGILDRLRTGDLPGACRLRFLVTPPAEDAFVAVIGEDEAPPGCQRAVRWEVVG